MENKDLKTAFQLRKERKYRLAIQIYTSFSADQLAQWDLWAYIYCLTKEGNYNQALELSRMGYLKFKDFVPLNNLYALTIFHTQFIKNKTLEESLALKAIQAIFKLSPPDSPYSIASIATLKYVKFLMSKPEIKWDEIEAWLLKVDPDLLSKNPYNIEIPNGKNLEMASPYEEWYAMMIRTKAGKNEPKELLNLINITKTNQIKWHYNNDIWFARKEAFAYLQLGNKIKAEELLRKVLSLKNDWFLKFDLAKVVQNKNEALKLLYEAALEKGKIEMKIKLFETLYEKLEEKPTNETERKLILQLIIGLKKDKQWPIQQVWLAEAEKLNIDYNKLPQLLTILDRIKIIWKEALAKDAKNGVIQTILPHGKAGFIKSGKDSFYFKIENKNYTIGQSVKFHVVAGFDKKKNKSTSIAQIII